MPRVSAAHLAARRDHILAAATRCFSRNGFHATSMHDVIAEAGVSVGAVYRYFKSKEELRGAIAEQHVSSITAALDELLQRQPALPLSEAMDKAIDILEPRLAPEGSGRIVLQVWAESLRDTELRSFMETTIEHLRNGTVMLAQRAQDAGHLPSDADPERVGLALFSILPGYLVQRVVTGRPDSDTIKAGVRALLDTRCG